MSAKENTPGLAAPRALSEALVEGNEDMGAIGHGAAQDTKVGVPCHPKNVIIKLAHGGWPPSSPLVCGVGHGPLDHTALWEEAGKVPKGVEKGLDVVAGGVHHHYGGIQPPIGVPGPPTRVQDQVPIHE